MSRNSVLYAKYGIEAQRYISLRNLFEYLEDCALSKHGDYLKEDVAQSLIETVSTRFQGIAKRWSDQPLMWYELLAIFKQEYGLKPNEKQVYSDIMNGFRKGINPTFLPDVIPRDADYNARLTPTRKDSIAVGYAILSFISGDGKTTAAIVRKSILLEKDLDAAAKADAAGSQGGRSFSQVYDDVMKVAEESMKRM